MDNDIRPRFEKWARQYWDNPAMQIAIPKGAEPYYPHHNVQMAWLAWKEASEGERARVAACMV